MLAESQSNCDLRSMIADAARTLAAAGAPTARLDAEVLMAEAVGVSRSAVVAGAFELDGAAVQSFSALVARRVAREPLAYIVRRKEFFSLDFEVTPATLIPRPETETLVAHALAALRGNPDARVLDMGTGCGAIAIAIATEAPCARIAASDISQASLEVAERNAIQLGCASGIRFVHADCWAGVDDSFDLVVSNPPYVAENALARLDPEVALYEPRIALCAGRDGLDFYRRMGAGIGSHLRNGGQLLVEVGAGQAEEVAELWRSAGASRIEFADDLSGIARVVRADF